MENCQEMNVWMEKMEKSSRNQARCAKRQLIFSMIGAVCCAGVLVIVLSVLPQVQEFTRQMQTVATQVQELGTQAETVLGNLETVSSELADAGLADMVENVDSLVTSSQEGLEQALEKFNAMDIETLNSAIKNLSAVIDPLAKFFKAFG